MIPSFPATDLPHCLVFNAVFLRQIEDRISVCPLVSDLANFGFGQFRHRMPAADVAGSVPLPIVGILLGQSPCQVPEARIPRIIDDDVPRMKPFGARADESLQDQMVDKSGLRLSFCFYAYFKISVFHCCDFFRMPLTPRARISPSQIGPVSSSPLAPHPAPTRDLVSLGIRDVRPGLRKHGYQESDLSRGAQGEDDGGPCNELVAVGRVRRHQTSESIPLPSFVVTIGLRPSRPRDRLRFRRPDGVDGIDGVDDPFPSGDVCPGFIRFYRGNRLRRDAKSFGDLGLMESTDEQSPDFVDIFGPELGGTLISVDHSVYTIGLVRIPAEVIEPAISGVGVGGVACFFPGWTWTYVDQEHEVLQGECPVFAVPVAQDDAQMPGLLAPARGQDVSERSDLEHRAAARPPKPLPEGFHPPGR